MFTRRSARESRGAPPSFACRKTAPGCRDTSGVPARKRGAEVSSNPPSHRDPLERVRRGALHGPTLHTGEGGASSRALSARVRGRADVRPTIQGRVSWSPKDAGDRDGETRDPERKSASDTACGRERNRTLPRGGGRFLAPSRHLAINPPRGWAGGTQVNTFPGVLRASPPARVGCSVVAADSHRSFPAERRTYVAPGGLTACFHSRVGESEGTAAVLSHRRTRTVADRCGGAAPRPLQRAGLLQEASHSRTCRSRAAPPATGGAWAFTFFSPRARRRARSSQLTSSGDPAAVTGSRKPTDLPWYYLCERSFSTGLN